MNKTPAIVLALSVAAVAVGCSTGGPSAADADKVAAEMVRTGFRSQGIAKVERVPAIDETLQACNAADVAGKPLDPAVARRLEEANLKAVKWPTDGKFLGDWKEGEKIAQSGRGQTWTDTASTPTMRAAAPRRPRKRDVIDSPESIAQRLIDGATETAPFALTPM